MSSGTATLAIVGNQRPRISHSPRYGRSRGPEAIELAAMAGLILYDWQQWILTEALGETPDGKWTAREVGLMVSRQNGKGTPPAPPPPPPPHQPPPPPPPPHAATTQKKENPQPPRYVPPPPPPPPPRKE